MRKLAFSLLFFVSAYSTASSIVDSSFINLYAAQKLCANSPDLDGCVTEIVPIIAHDHLYVYARFLSNKNHLLSDWALYCKGRELPTFCMSVFERDYENFKMFVKEAVTNNQAAEKIKRCHRNMGIDSYTSTRNKQCIYQ